MSLDKKLKERIAQIDKNLDKIVKNPYEHKKPKFVFPAWAKISLSIGGAITACCLVAAVVLPITLMLGVKNNANGTHHMDGISSHIPEKGESSETKDTTHVPQDSSTHKIASSKAGKVVDAPITDMSAMTYNSYISFTKKFTKLVMSTNNSGSNEGNLGISIPDAYLCLAQIAMISDDYGKGDILSYLDLSSMDELKISVREILSTLGSLYRNGDNELVGGYNLNSIWINPYKATLKEKDNTLYKDLEEVFDTSMYYNALTTEKMNEYLRDNGLEGFPTPEVKLEDGAQSADAIDVVSTYYCLDNNTPYISSANSRVSRTDENMLNFKTKGSSKSVKYLDTLDSKKDDIYTGSNFKGASMDLEYFNAAFFLPDDENALPSSILDDVLNSNYETTRDNTRIEAPYFLMDNNIEIKGQSLKSQFPNLTIGGMGSKLIEENVAFKTLKQFSTMRFNYDGFYSCSVTIGGGSSSIPPKANYTLTLDHPYLFEVRKTVNLDNDQSANIPMVIGEIVNPEYSE